MILGMTQDTGIHGILRKDKRIDQMSNYNLIKETDTLKKCFKTLKGSFNGLICVISKTKKLLGTVSDGDLRRSMLKGMPLNSKVDEVMNKKPTFIYVDELKSKIFKKSRINFGKTMDRSLIIPVLDSSNKVVKLINSEKLFDTLITRKTTKNLQFKRPHILIVGGAGYIGSVLTAKLLKKNYKVKIVDKILYEKNSLKKHKKNKNFSLIKKDICDIQVQINALKDIDAVVFLAEIVGDPSCAVKPEDALKTNFIALGSMANLCSYMNINRFVYTSSCSVYGSKENQEGLLNETSPLNPVSHYARMKILSEKVLLTQSNNFFSPTILRLATVYGPSFRNRFDLVVNIFAKSAFFNKKIKVFGGTQWRPNIHVDDVASAILKVLESPLNKVEKKIFNVANSNENYTINDLAKITKKIFKNCQIDSFKKVVDKRNYKVDTKKIKKEIGFRAKNNIKKALIEFKMIFENKKIKNPNLKKFSNYDSLK